MPNNRYYNPKIIASLLKLGAPVVAGNVGLVLMGLIDNAMVGSLGYVPLAAAGISNTVYFIVTIFGIGVLMVFSANIAAEQTQKEAETENLIGASLLINVLVSIFTFVVLLIVYHNFGIFDQTDTVTNAALPYLKLLIYSSWPMFLYLTFKSVSDGHNLTKAAMYATLLALVLNIFLNWVFIFGNLGSAKYGLTGAGYATFVSRSFMALFMLLYCVYHHKIVFYWKTFKTKIYKKHINTLLALGIPSGGQFFFEVSAFAGAAIIAGWIGEHELAAHTVAIQLAAFTYMFASGISVAGMIKTGETWAQKKYQKTLDIGRNTFLLVSIFMAISALIFVLFRIPMVRLFAENNEVVIIASELMILAAFFQFFDGIQAVSLGLLRGMNDTKIPSYITLVVYWAVALPLAYWLGIHTQLAMTGVWIALTLALILASIFLYIRFINITKSQIQQ
ncbi:MAG: MATE family efflux transporter [Bacteroidetes bacterium]|nr:MATE family efflux transporter [Bacteroidota bacterium]